MPNYLNMPEIKVPDFNAAPEIAQAQLIQAAAMSNQLKQREMQRRQQLQNALSGWGRPGADRAGIAANIMPLDPELSMKLEDRIKKMDEDTQKGISDSIGFYDKAKSFIYGNPNRLAMWPSFRDDMVNSARNDKARQLLAHFLPPSFPDKETMDQFLLTNEVLAARLKQAGLAPHAVEGALVAPTGKVLYEPKPGGTPRERAAEVAAKGRVEAAAIAAAEKRKSRLTTPEQITAKAVDMANRELSRNLEYLTMPEGPRKAAVFANTLNKYMRGLRGLSQFPDRIVAPGGMAKRLNEYSPEGYPFYQWPDGTKKLLAPEKE